MRAQFPVRFLVPLAVACSTVLSSAHGADSPLPGAVPRAPVIEVVAFGVAPVAGVPESTQLQPRGSDILHRIDAFGTRAATDGDVELRTMVGESWRDLLARAGPRLGDGMLPEHAATAQLHLLPQLQPGKYVRLRGVP